jgi:ElaB/YqjD/DUF883 family membrane-anchored ribosome-binding protein
MTDNDIPDYSGDHIDFRNAQLHNSPVFIGATLQNVNFGLLPNATQDTRQQLEDLKKQLTEVLQQVATDHPDHQEDAEIVAELTQDLADSAQAEKPRRRMLEIKGENLVKAAENLAKVTPTVVGIAKQIVGLIIGLGV